MGQGQGGGAPSKISAKITAAICKHLRSGNYIETSCAAVGISVDTFHRWLKAGADAERSTNKYRKFSVAVREELAKAEVNLVEKYYEACTGKGDGKPKIIADFLARRWSNRWGIKQVIGNIDLPTDPATGRADLSALSTDEVEDVLRLLKKAKGAVPNGLENGNGNGHNGNGEENGNGDTNAGPTESNGDRLDGRVPCAVVPVIDKPVVIDDGNEGNGDGPTNGDSGGVESGEKTETEE